MPDNNNRPAVGSPPPPPLPTPLSQQSSQPSLKFKARDPNSGLKGNLGERRSRADSDLSQSKVDSSDKSTSMTDILKSSKIFARRQGSVDSGEEREMSPEAKLAIENIRAEKAAKEAAEKARSSPVPAQPVAPVAKLVMGPDGVPLPPPLPANQSLSPSSLPKPSLQKSNSDSAINTTKKQSGSQQNEKLMDELKTKLLKRSRSTEDLSGRQDSGMRDKNVLPSSANLAKHESSSPPPVSPKNQNFASSFAGSFPSNTGKESQSVQYSTKQPISSPNHPERSQGVAAGKSLGVANFGMNGRPTQLQASTQPQVPARPANLMGGRTTPQPGSPKPQVPARPANLTRSPSAEKKFGVMNAGVSGRATPPPIAPKPEGLAARFVGNQTGVANQPPALMPKSSALTKADNPPPVPPRSKNKDDSSFVAKIAEQQKAAQDKGVQRG